MTKPFGLLDIRGISNRGERRKEALALLLHPTGMVPTERDRVGPYRDDALKLRITHKFFECEVLSCVR